MGIDKALDITRPTATALGTVLIRIQDGRGHDTVFEVTRKMWIDMRDEVDFEFQRIARQAEQAAAILDIERHDSVV